MVKVKVRASEVRFGDRLLDEHNQRGHAIIHVRTRNGQVLLTHGNGETRYLGDPLGWVLRREPRIINEDNDLPENIWNPRQPNHFPWEGAH